ncbi:hypothetical protein BG015_003052, partial [Linnemannia schmuckeri]
MGDERVVLVRKETSFRKIVQRIQEKFQSSQPFRIKFNNGYKDEKVSMVDNEDWVLAQRCFDIKLWCFSQPDSIHPSNRIGTGSSQAKEDSTSGVKTRTKEELLEESNEYLDETAFAVILDRLANNLEVKCYYTDDVRVVLVREDITFRKLVQRIQEKFQSTRPLKLTSERFGGALMVDDEDWLLVQQRSVENQMNLELCKTLSLKQLSKALEINKTLTTLDLRRNSIGPGGAQALSETLKINAKT